MKSENKIMEMYRVKGNPSFGTTGKFEIPHKGTILTVVASSGGGWDHVSVSTPSRCPTWDEMVFVKDRFFLPSETVIQFHPAEEAYINHHPFCLHLWLNQQTEIILPPWWMLRNPQNEDEKREYYEACRYLQETMA